jgi:hypothetical protein
MKIKVWLFGALAAAGVAGGAWFYSRHKPPQSGVASTAGRQALYYTCAMHPWVRENKPGPCPVCGMNLTPVYGKEKAATAETNAAALTITLEPESISVINVQTDLAERRPLRRTLHLAGEISWNSPTAAWFEFTAYERDLQWLKIGQVFEVSVSSVPDRIYKAQIKAHSAKPFADEAFDMMTSSTKVRAEISDPPVEAGNFGKYKLFNGLHAEAHFVAETDDLLTVPRSAIISRGIGPMVYVDTGGGHYAPRAVRLGRVGDAFCEVLGGLNEGEKVVTTGNVLIDSEAQLAAGQ